MQVTQRFAQLLKQNVGKVIVGKESAVELMMIAVLCRGHVLIEDVPGVGKTTLASALARSLDCSFKRIQFTPDITPSDITGSKRGQDIMLARQSAIYLTRRLTKYSLPEIGAAFGGRDHTTIMHSINKIENALPKDEKLNTNIETLIKTIRQE